MGPWGLTNVAQNPWPHPSAEQTVSWLSFIFYFFVGDTIRDAARVDHLSLDKLPPIADFDDAENLMRKSLHVCGPYHLVYVLDERPACYRNSIPSKPRRGAILLSDCGECGVSCTRLNSYRAECIAQQDLSGSRWCSLLRRVYVDVITSGCTHLNGLPYRRRLSSSPLSASGTSWSECHPELSFSC